jgi:hypothetical protein
LYFTKLTETKLSNLLKLKVGSFVNNLTLSLTSEVRTADVLLTDINLKLQISVCVKRIPIIIKAKAVPQHSPEELWGEEV